MEELNLLIQLNKDMINKFKFYIFLTSFITVTFNILASNINITGLSKLNINDLQTQTLINLNKDFYSDDEVNTLLKDLYKSDLIFDLNYKKDGDLHNIFIQENKLIENIFINGNYRVEDELIFQNISTITNGFLNKNIIDNDINIIESIYKVKGFNNINVIVSTEKFSSDRVNLIFNITENDQSQIERINFIGNKSFSNRYLSSIINTKSRNFYNIFASGSNLNIENFNFDVNKIKFFYRQKGFFETKVNFNIYETSSNKYTVTFFIDEGERLILDDVKIDYPKSSISEIMDKNFDKFKIKLSKNNFFYDQTIIDDFLTTTNKILINNNNFNTIYVYNLDFTNNKNILFLNTKTIEPSRINKINIYGNDITKDKTIRSKLSFEPGDYFNDNLLEITKKELLKNKYINDVTITNEINDGISDINIDIEENKKTGQVLAGGTFSGDNGAGITLSARDSNIFGTGNSLDSNFTLNQERALYKISLTQYPIAKSNIKNTYTIFNTETDLSNSFGFETNEIGLSYSINFDYDEMIDITSGFSFKRSDRHSAKENISSINENIGNYDIYTLNLSLRQDSTDDYLYPTDGISNSFYFEYSPKDLSDDSYYKIIFKNDTYRKFKNSNRFLFLSNDFGFADSLEGNLSTVNVFSLGGLNFKGFDYRGVGPKQNNIYLGGNKFFTSTLGFGGSFLFDEKDNINTKFFYSVGSIWDSDYTNDNNFETRSSAGISFDVLTAVGPLSFSYAVPINKNTNDRTNEFNFSIGTSF